MLNPLTWIAASLAAYAIVVNALWIASSSRDRRAHRFVELARRPQLATAARALYLLGIPALAITLRLGDLRPSHMGLMRPRGPLALTLVVLVALLTVALLVGSRLWLARATGRPGPARPRAISPDEAGRLALSALMLEAHWAFFRAGPLSVGLRNATLAAFLGLGLLALEAWSNPWHRAAADDVDTALAMARRAILAVQSTLVFLISGSSLVSLAAHVAVAGALRSTVAGPGSSADEVRLAMPPAPSRRTGGGESAGQPARPTDE